MKQQTNPERLDKLAEEYNTHADYRSHMAEAPALLSRTSGCGLQRRTKLAGEAKGSSQPT